MKKTLQNELNSIQKHIDRNFKRWFKTYSDIEGINIGEKRIKGEIVKKCYSIVFHVKKKIIATLYKVPQYIHVRINGDGKRKVPTDVVEAGKLIFNGIKIGDNTKNRNSTLVGTISFY